MKSTLEKLARQAMPRIRSPINYSTIFIGTGLMALGFVLFQAFLPLAETQDYSVKPVDVEYPVPDVSLVDLYGISQSLDEWRGYVILINLWATWCPPCKAEMPTLQHYFLNHKDEHFLLVGINNGEPAALVDQFVTTLHLTFPIWLDPEYETEKAFGTISLPSSYVVDRKGIVRLMWIGEIEYTTLEEYVTPLIME